jgi:CheY-like chemotaxis protein
MKDARILVATDVVADADLVKELLGDDFDHVVVSTDPDKAVDDFDSNRPDVLILAFNTLEKAERYYLGLYRLSTLVNAASHRTLILCGRDELQRVYELCRKSYFDDYVLFWPMTSDVQRLPMAVTHALRDLERSRGAAPTAEMARQARRIDELEGLLEQRSNQDDHPAKTPERHPRRAEVIGTASAGHPKTVIAGRFVDGLEIRTTGRVQTEVDMTKTNESQPHVRDLDEAMQPFGQWVSDMNQPPHHASMPAAKAPSVTARPLVLVVDDDEFERKLTGEILSAAPYDLLFAGNGAEALDLMREKRPDLILMDMVMPEINGLETLRRLKASHRLADIPVMMITGQSEKDVVVECLKAGAVDFVVKPLDREVLLKKVERFLTG